MQPRRGRCWTPRSRRPRRSVPGRTPRGRARCSPRSPPERGPHQRRTSGSPAPPPTLADMETRLARREVALFVVLQAALGLGTTAVGISQDVNVIHIEDASALGQAATYGAALTPLVAALVARFATTRTLRGWGFRRVSWRTLVRAWALG